VKNHPGYLEIAGLGSLMTTDLSSAVEDNKPLETAFKYCADELSLDRFIGTRFCIFDDRVNPA
jgi:hypothetical protein